LRAHRRHIQTTERENEEKKEAERARPTASRKTPADIAVH
jgi:hypothetical protein